MTGPIDDRALDQIFREAHTAYGYLDRPVEPELLRTLWDLANLGPTSANAQPARVIWCVSGEAKARLAGLVSGNNADRVRSAPVAAIVAMDLAFHDALPRTFPHTDARSWFAGNDALIEATAFRNSSLQGAYLIVAARALGLGAGPMSGFDAEAVDREFLGGTGWRSNLIMTLGYADAEGAKPRNPRLGFDEATRIV